MQIRIIIVLSIFLFGSCSVLKLNQNQVSKEGNSDKDIISFEKFDSLNISANSFYIQKVNIKIDEKEKIQEFIGNIKYYNSDNFLISLRSVAGIEFIRIFVNKDSIFMLDRINKTIYEGEEDSFYRKYGIKKDYLLVLLGDIVSDKSNNYKILGREGQNYIIQMISDNLMIKYRYNSVIGKVLNSEINEYNKAESVTINYSSFKRIGNKSYPRKIDIHNLQEINKLSLRIKRMEIPWEGEIRFIKGKEYTIIKI